MGIIHGLIDLSMLQQVNLPHDQKTIEIRSQFLISVTWTKIAFQRRLMEFYHQLPDNFGIYDSGVEKSQLFEFHESAHYSY
jgi:hypothetical protein